jgi:hypothetical protein
VRRGGQRNHAACAEHHPDGSTSPGRAASRSRSRVAAVERVDKRFRPELTIKRILELADAYHARTDGTIVLIQGAGRAPEGGTPP